MLHMRNLSSEHFAHMLQVRQPCARIHSVQRDRIAGRNRSRNQQVFFENCKSHLIALFHGVLIERCKVQQIRPISIDKGAQYTTIGETLGCLFEIMREIV